MSTLLTIKGLVWVGILFIRHVSEKIIFLQNNFLDVKQPFWYLTIQTICVYVF